MSPHRGHSLAVAFRTLFQGESGPPSDPLAGLLLADLKVAFKRRALRCHPDRALALGRSPKELEKEFISITHAYNVLARSLANPNASVPAEGASSPRRSGSGRTGPDHHWAQPIPSNVLKLGQFLFYSGRISWRNLIESLTWQRKQRPLFGQIALGWGYATPEEIRAMLTQRRPGEAIGDAAIRMGLLSRYARDAVVRRQRGLQRPLGEYFIEKGLLTAEELQELLRGQALHNWQVEAARYRAHHRRR